MPPIKQRLSGLRKAAIVTLLIGEDATAEAFRFLSEDEIERLAREMTMVGAVDPGVSESTLEEFHNTLVANEFITKGDMNCARPVLIA